MISQDSISKIVRELEAETIRLKSAQPFFDGQLNMILISSASQYDATVTNQFPGSVISGNFQFVSDTQDNPLCSIVAALYVNGVPLTASQATEMMSLRVPYGNAKEVQYHFKFIINMPANTVIQIKGFATTSDTGTLTPLVWA